MLARYKNRKVSPKKTKPTGNDARVHYKKTMPPRERKEGGATDIPFTSSVAAVNSNHLRGRGKSNCPIRTTTGVKTSYSRIKKKAILCRPRHKTSVHKVADELRTISSSGVQRLCFSEQSRRSCLLTFLTGRPTELLKRAFSKKISLSDRCLSFYAAYRASCVRR